MVAVGTGQALKNARNGDGDVLLVHARPEEEAFVAEGWGLKRYAVMYNSFVIVGPANDPAKIGGMQETGAALRKLSQARLHLCRAEMKAVRIKKNRHCGR